MCASWSVDGTGGGEAIGTNIVIVSTNFQFPTPPPQETAPTFSPSPFAYLPATISISSSDSQAQIYFTLNGTAPTQASTPYTSPLTFTTETSLRACAFRAGYLPSQVTDGEYVAVETTNALTLVRTVSGDSADVAAISITATPVGNVSCYAVTESIDIGLAPVGLSAGAYWNPLDGTILWGPYFDNQPRTLAYQIIGPSATYPLAGQGSFDGFSAATTGATSVTIMNCVTAPPGLVAWYLGDGNAQDVVGGNNGTLEGGAGYANGQYALAFSFDGTGNVVIPNAPALSFSPNSPMSAEVWAYRNTSGGTMHMVGKRVSCGSMNYQLAFNEGSGEGLVFGNGIGDEVATGVHLPIGSWHHLVGTFDGATYRFYLDGQLIGSTAGSLGSPNSQPLLIGDSGDCAGFQGLLQNVRIYSVALTAQQVQYNYSVGSSGLCISTLPPAIIIPPTNQIAVPQTTVQFSVTATGSLPLFYQWYFNQTNFLSGETNTSLALSNITMQSAGLYCRRQQSLRKREQYPSPLSMSSKLSSPALISIPMGALQLTAWPFRTAPTRFGRQRI